jgi:hypothetical protein
VIDTNLLQRVDIKNTSWLVFFSPSGVRIVSEALKSSRELYESWVALPKAAIGINHQLDQRSTNLVLRLLQVQLQPKRSSSFLGSARR